MDEKTARATYMPFTPGLFAKYKLTFWNLWLLVTVGERLSSIKVSTQTYNLLIM